ncbi:phage tail assembly chaperone [Sagittula sp. NFXS13]
MTFGFATVHLGWPPSDFWSATPSEFWAAQAMHMQKVEAQNPK